MVNLQRKERYNLSTIYTNTDKYWNENGEEIFVESVILVGGKLRKRYTFRSFSTTDLLANEATEI